MDFHERTNLNRVLRTISKEMGVPVWMAKRVIQECIDKSWEKALTNPEEKARWDNYFPAGKPTAEDYILLLGRAKENNEFIPYLFSD